MAEELPPKRKKAKKALTPPRASAGADWPLPADYEGLALLVLQLRAELKTLRAAAGSEDAVLALRAAHKEVERLREEVRRLEGAFGRMGALERDLSRVLSKLDGLEERAGSAIEDVGTLKGRFQVVEQDLGRVVTLARQVSTQMDLPLPAITAPPPSSTPRIDSTPPPLAEQTGLGWQEQDGDRRPSGSMPAPRSESAARRDVTMLEQSGTQQDSDMERVEDELVTSRGERVPAKEANGRANRAPPS